MSEFHNPYHFVPVKDGSTAGWHSLEDWRQAKNSAETITHRRYHPKGKSGRIVCSLTTATPAFVGAERTPGSKTTPGKANHFTFDDCKTPALPASSLRGMIGAVMEAASNSAMRVLAPRTFSYRKAMEPDQILSAVGMVIVDKGRYLLKGLSIPTLEAKVRDQFGLPEAYREMFPRPLLKVHIGDHATIRSKSSPYQTFTNESPAWHIMPLAYRTWSRNHTIINDDLLQTTGRYLVGQKALQPEPVAFDGWQTRVPESRHANAVVGVIRALGCGGDRIDDIPQGKKRELFLPWPHEQDWPQKEIPQGVVDRFHALCDERWEASKERHKNNLSPLLPFHPVGTRRNEKSDEGRFRLKTGDLVYFKAAMDGARSEITELSLSSIWRGMVVDKTGRAADATRFFPPNRLPFDGERDISPAEAVLGFVEHRPEKAQTAEASGKQATALASRVRFSTGMLSPGQADLWDKEATLKVLDSPKPPSPALYFKPRGSSRGGFIAKSQLKPELHEAQGRKVYLHHPGGGRPWETQRPGDQTAQKVRIKPMRAALSFQFHVDFDNLTDDELGMLLYALEPRDTFQHKLGMGKSLGLGSVKVRPLGLFLLNRQQRYTPEGLKTPRYHEATIAPDAERESWPEERYAREKAAQLSEPAGMTEFAERFRNSMDPEILSSLEILGDPKQVLNPVRTPTVQGQDPEKETFQWFVANDSPRGLKDRDREIPRMEQFLPPMPGGGRIPTLKEGVWRRRQRR